jgi:hypothetical protein
MAARYWWLGSLPLEPEHSNRLRGHGLLQLPQTECGVGLCPALSLCAHQRYGRTNGTYPKEITSVTKGNLRGSSTDVENPGTGRDDPGRSQIATEIATDLTDDSSVPPHFMATRRPRSDFVEGWLEIFCGRRDPMLRVVSQLHQREQPRICCAGFSLEIIRHAA